jgi:hypothetical protein
MALTQQPVDRVHAPSAVVLAYVYFYDQRGGGVETAIKGDTQGWGRTKRHKKRFEAQQMVTQLHALAHNTIVWARQELPPSVPGVRGWGLMRMVRDVVHVSGQIVFDHRQSISQIMLNLADPLATGLAPGLFALLGSEHIAVTLGQI